MRSDRADGKNIAEVLFCRQAILAVVILSALVLAGGFLLSDDEDYSLMNRTLTATDALETAVTSDGCSLINDGATSVFCIDKSGKLKYRIKMKGDNSITGMTLDDNDNLYAYVSIQEKGGSDLLRDEITKYDKNGNFVKVLYTINYMPNTEKTSGESSSAYEKNPDKATARTSPLYCRDGCLYFVAYSIRSNKIFKIDLSTEKCTLIADIKSNTPYLYTDIAPISDSTYYYIKLTGEIGRGKIGGSERVICTTIYNIKTGSGKRPFYVRHNSSGTYVLDFWAGRLYEIKNGSLERVKATGDSQVVSNDYYVDELSTLGSRIYGITDGVPWHLEDGKITRMANEAKVGILQALSGSAGNLMRKIMKPFLLCVGVYFLIFMLWFAFCRGKKFFWKMMAVFMAVFIVFIISTYMIFASEQKAFTKRMTTLQTEDAVVAANTIDASEIISLKTSGDMESKAFNDISSQLMKNYSIYQSSSDTAAVLLVKGDKGASDIMIASNRGFGGFFGYYDEFSQIIAKLGNRNGVNMTFDSLVMSCAPVKTEDGTVAGYLCIYTTGQSIQKQFIDLWSVPIIAGGILMILLALLLSSMLVTRPMREVSKSIGKIIEGDYSTRVTHLPLDETGDAGRCVNALAENIEDLLRRNEEQKLQIQESQEEVFISLAVITEAKSGQTAEHVRRVAAYVALMAREYGGFTAEQVRSVSTAAMLHDIGKLMVPVEILEKPAKLTAGEFEVIKLHPLDGEKLLHNGVGEIMNYARIIALEHHERWDGNGYPDGKAGEEISVEARITALADVFDALVSRRSYKEAYSVDFAYDTIVKERGRQFDPKAVDIFKEHFDEFCKIASCSD